MNSEQRQTWQMTGKLPERSATETPADAAADSSPATPVEQAPSTEGTETKAASEPAAPAKKERGAKARNAELDGEIAELNRKLELRRALREELGRTEVKPDAKPAESSPAAPTQAEYERYLAMPDAPKEENFDSYAKFTAAMGVFIADKRWAEHQSRLDATHAERTALDTAMRAAEKPRQRLAERMADPDYVASVDPRLIRALSDVTPASLLPRDAKVGPMNVIADRLMRLEDTPELLQHFSTEQGQQDWRRLMTASSPDDLLAGFGELVATLRHTRTAAAAPKHVSSAPAPGTVLGARPADVADPVATAAKSGDFARYEREANKRALQSLGR